MSRRMGIQQSVWLAGGLVVLVGVAGAPANAQEGGPVVLSEGHVDAFEVSLGDGELVMMLKDDTVFGESAFRDPADVILQAVPESEWVVPDWVADFPEWGFLGEVGDIVYRLPDIHTQGLLWPREHRASR